MIYEYARNRDILRETWGEVRKRAAEIDNANVDNALSYFSRLTDHAEVEDRLKKRYAFGIRRPDATTSTNPSTVDGGYETYVKQGASLIIEQGSEKVTSGVGHRICSTLADLLTNETAYFDYVTAKETTDETGKVTTEAVPVDEVAEAVNKQREAGGYWTEGPNADYISVAVESGPLFHSWASGHMKYKAFSPSCLHAIFGEVIYDGNEERVPDYTNLEDAVVVVLELSDGTQTNTISADKRQFLAIFGRSADLPYGRSVTYLANRWDEIPDIGTPDAVEWKTKTGDIANPLSWYAATSDVDNAVEYPITIMRGGLTLTNDKLLPTSTSLWQSCLEIDVAMSRILHCSLLSARGTNAVTNERGAPLPETLEGGVALQNGQTMVTLNQPVANSTGAMDIVIQLAKSVAEGYSVPGHHILTESGGTQLESGVALYIRTQPLVNYKDRRAKLNMAEIAKTFEIEKGLHKVHTGKPLAGPDVVQVWMPGRHTMPESQADKATRIQGQLDAGLISYPAAIMELHNLANIAQAKARIEEMNKDNAEYPPPKKAGTQAPGLALGLKPRPPRPPKGGAQPDAGDNKDDNTAEDTKAP